MNNIEVEIRSFLDKNQYLKLLSFFKKNAEFVKKDYQETYYFDTKKDLRIQKNNSFSKIWLKKGNLHDDSREEIEVKFSKGEFEKIKNIFLSLGFNVEIKWLRERYIFKWEDIKVCLDNTQGYGYIIELEKMANNEEKKRTLKSLEEKFNKLKIKKTPKKEFDRKFIAYKKNWKKILSL